ncbi:MAG: hypothetical protein M3Z02_00690 [Actinomycetota bacterium]|nr:hypothetical protein [Actinomycetota bacterium]
MVPHEVATQLRRLATASGDEDALSSDLDELLALVQRSVPSCVAVSVTMGGADARLTFTAVAQPADLRAVRASLYLRLPGGRAGVSEAARPVLLVHASSARAFDQMTVDLLALLDIDPSRATVDGHLGPPAAADTDTTGNRLDDVSAVNRALGVLLDRGLLPSDGQAELARLARAGDSSVPAAACRLLAALSEAAAADGDARADRDGPAGGR